MVSPLPPSSIPVGGAFDPILKAPAMAVVRSSHKVGDTKPQARPFNKLLSRISQRSQLAAPKYEDSTKQAIVHV
jgi:hypothetical protein